MHQKVSPDTVGAQKSSHLTCGVYTIQSVLYMNRKIFKKMVKFMLYTSECFFIGPEKQVVMKYLPPITLGLFGQLVPVLCEPGQPPAATIDEKTKN